jgi:hypothetical protein
VSAVDLHDTSGCGLAPWCEMCGAETGLATVIVTVMVAVDVEGVFCMTLCPRCDAAPGYRMSAGIASQLIMRHDDHLADPTCSTDGDVECPTPTPTSP